MLYWGGMRSGWSTAAPLPNWGAGLNWGGSGSRGSQGGVTGVMGDMRLEKRRIKRRLEMDMTKIHEESQPSPKEGVGIIVIL